jgi:uracil-DNA glycosylase
MQNIGITLNIVDKSESIDSNWTLLDIVKKRPPNGWKKLFEDSFDEFEDIQDFLSDQEKQYGYYYPEKKNLFRAFELTPLNNVRVVLCGQDPYIDLTKTTGEIRAQGLSFSVSRTSDIPPSLKNIFKELSTDIPEFKMPTHGDLTFWALQGVLLLNKCLTVNPSLSKSHKQIWNSFLYRVVEAVINTNPKCIFVLWGRESQKLNKLIRGRCPVLEASHPSSMNTKGGFLGCRHFSKINSLLGDKPIDWNLY